MHIGQHCSSETKAKISASRMKQYPSPESRAKMSVAQTGRIESPETRAKISLARKGKLHPHKGVLPSCEARAKMSVAHKGMRLSPEQAVRSGIAHWKGGPTVSNRKHNAKRRLMGFHPLNTWFLGCEAHHINPQDVIYLPHKLHRSIWHCQRTGKGMAAINALAGQYLTEDWT
jgi:hypothetical protein